ncbi:hypothetical protein U1Q18_014226 [Sarracenia purpurea var. burkii]
MTSNCRSSPTTTTPSNLRRGFRPHIYVQFTTESCATIEGFVKAVCEDVKAVCAGFLVVGSCIHFPV